MKKIIFLSLALALITAGCSLTDKNKMVIISPEEIKVMATSFINENLLQPGTEATIKEVSDENGMYKLKISLPGGQDGNGQEVDSYVSKDGKKFFVSGLDVEEVKAKNQANKTPAEGEAQANTTTPKTDKPVV